MSKRTIYILYNLFPNRFKINKILAEIKKLKQNINCVNKFGVLDMYAFSTHSHITNYTTLSLEQTRGSYECQNILYVVSYVI